MVVTSDEDLLLAARSGDAESFGTLVARWERPLFHFVYRMIARTEDARDICQETFLRVLKTADRFRPGAKYSTWMYQIALNLCRDQLRRKRRWSLVVVEGNDPRDPERPEPAGTQADPAALAERSERSAVVARALDRIPPEQREVLVLKEYQGLKFREIAELLGCPESTVKSRMYYGLNGLKTALVREGFPVPRASRRSKERGASS